MRCRKLYNAIRICPRVASSVGVLAAFVIAGNFGEQILHYGCGSSTYLHSWVPKNIPGSVTWANSALQTLDSLQHLIICLTLAIWNAHPYFSPQGCGAYRCHVLSHDEKEYVGAQTSSMLLICCGGLAMEFVVLALLLRSAVAGRGRTDALLLPLTGSAPR